MPSMPALTPLALILYDPRSGAAPVPSPCISVCRMTAATGVCEGCQRDLDEITRWSSASETEKRRIWHAINQRRALAHG